MRCSSGVPTHSAGPFRVAADGADLRPVIERQLSSLPLSVSIPFFLSDANETHVFLYMFPLIKLLDVNEWGDGI